MTSHGRAQAPVAASASTACASSVASSAAGARERGAQHAVAKHLRRLRLPQPGAVLGAQHARRRLAVLPLQRVGHRNRQQPADRVVARARPRAAAARPPARRAARRRARCTQSSAAQCDAIAASALATVSAREAPPQRSVSTPRRGADHRVVQRVVGRQRDDGGGEVQRRGEPLDRAHEQRRAAEIGVLLGQRGAEAAAAAGRRNQGDEPRRIAARIAWTADGSTRSSEQQRDALLVERPEAQALVERHAPALSRWHAAVDARDAVRRAGDRRAPRASRRRRRGPCQPSAIVTSSSLTTSAAARRRDRVAGDARADRLRRRRVRARTRARRSRSPDARGRGRARARAPRRRRRRTRRSTRGNGRRRARKAPSSAAAAPRVAAVIGAHAALRRARRVLTRPRHAFAARSRAAAGVRHSTPHPAAGTTSGSSAARMRGGTGVGRCVARSTQTWTKRPLAAGASSPRRKMPIS